MDFVNFSEQKTICNRLGNGRITKYFHLLGGEVSGIAELDIDRKAHIEEIAQVAALNERKIYKIIQSPNIYL